MNFLFTLIIESKVWKNAWVVSHILSTGYMAYNERVLIYHSVVLVSVLKPVLFAILFLIVSESRKMLNMKNKIPKQHE